MLEPEKPGDGGTPPPNPAQQKDSTKQVDSSDMSIPGEEDGAESQPPAA